MTPNPRHLAETLRNIATLLDTAGPTAHRNARDALQAHGYPSGGQNGPRSSDTPRPTETTAIHADTSEAGHARRWHQALQDLEDACRHLNGALRPMMPTTLKPKLPAGAGDCMACGRYCPGGPDRLRAGLCSKHYQAIVKAQHKDPGMDRSAWIRRVAETEWVGSDDSEKVPERYVPAPLTAAIGTMEKYHRQLESA